MTRTADLEQLTAKFLGAMHLTLTPTITEAEDHVRIDLTGPDAYLLLEKKGTVLDALQLVMGKVAERTLNLDKRLVVDCEQFRSGTEADLIKAALEVAKTVRLEGRPMQLEPMNPYQRRLVHLALQNEPGVSSQSHGDGFLKRITISPV